MKMTESEPERLEVEEEHVTLAAPYEQKDVTYLTEAGLSGLSRGGREYLFPLPAN